MIITLLLFKTYSIFILSNVQGECGCDNSITVVPFCLSESWNENKCRCIIAFSLFYVLQMEIRSSIP